MTAKNLRAQQRVQNPAASGSSPSIAGLKTWQIDLIACAAIFLAVFILFREIPLQGKTFSRGDDSESAASMNTFSTQEAKVREFPMWCPYIFGGFPSLSAGAYSNYEEMGMPYALANRYLSPRYWADLISINGLFLGGGNDHSSGARWILSLLMYGGLLTYLLMRRLGFRPLIGFFAAMIMAWNPYLISLATAAHGGKLMTFIYMPLIILAAWNVLEKRRLFDMSLLALAFGWQIAVGGHTQILFYSLVTVGLLYLVWAVLEAKENGFKFVFKPAGFIAVALILGFGVGALWYIPLKDYLAYSIRGMGPAIAQAGAASGYSITEATGWSFAPSELITFVIPSWFGLKSPYYWGDMPFTSSSFYFGVIPLFFAVLAFFGKKDRLFWGLLTVSVFSILLSFGSHFESFYSLFFNYLPFFNKFRTPSLILLLVELTGIIFAGYGIRFVLGLPADDKWRKAFLTGAVICAALLVIFVVLGESSAGMFGSFSRAGEEQRYSVEQMQQLHTMRFSMMHKDLLIALLWLAVAFAACWAKLSNKLKATPFLIILVLVTVIDLGRFSSQFFDPQPAGSTLETLQPNRIVQKLKQDTGYYRVLPIGGNLLQDNRWAAWEIPSLGGYHGAKMRSYQDMYENVFFNGPDRRIPLNMAFFSAMNCKYIVAEGQLPPTLGLEMVEQDPTAKQILYRNPQALERAYFPDSIVVLSDRTETVRKLADSAFPWSSTVIVEQSLPGLIGHSPDRTARITEYTPQHVAVQAHTPVPSLMVLSDAYYKPGWEAKDNGQSTPIYKVNGFVRGVYLTPGDHTIQFEYTGKAEHRGILVATLSHFLVWGLVIGTFLWERKRRQKAAV